VAGRTPIDEHPAGCRRAAELMAALQLLEQVPGEELDAVVRVAAAVTGLACGTVNLLDETDQHQLSCSGFTGGPSPREESLCDTVLQQGSHVRAFRDLSAEPHLRSNPWVDGRRGRVRAYATAPLVLDGTVLGTLCVFDPAPRDLTPEQTARLADLATVVVGVFHRRRQARQLAELAAASEAARAATETAHGELGRRAAFSRALLEVFPVGVVATDAEGRITTVNRLGREWHGVTDRDLPADLRVDDLPVLFDLVDAEGVPVAAGSLALQRALTEGDRHQAEVSIARPGRPVRFIASSSTPVHDDEGRLLGAVVALSDVTAQRELEAALRTAALHDPLTGLPNRTLLVQRLELALRTGQREPVSLAVLYCDLDGFKLVNDLAGHAVGDEVLVQAARRLRAVVRPADTVARIGGDEFVVLCPGLGSADVVDRAAARITEAFGMPMASEGDAEYRVGVSIGVSLCTEADTPETALAAADARMYEVKASRRSRGRGRLAAVPRR
jgi:diguanylate cyclase (GGDEF)-like protein/PAS domain S-box-containing protein